jgi:hypothetical protein
MPKKLTNFLSELAIHPEKLAMYLKDRDAAMKEAALDSDDCAALNSSDPAELYARLAERTDPQKPPKPPTPKPEPPEPIKPREIWVTQLVA